MERQDASLKSHEEATKTVLADMTQGNCFKNVFPNDLYFALTDMSHLVSYDDFKGTIVEQVAIRRNTEKTNPMGWSSHRRADFHDGHQQHETSSLHCCINANPQTNKT